MAITDKEKGVWGLDQTFNKINQGSIWEYNAPGDPGQLLMWGSNNKGQLGQGQGPGELSYVSSPVQIPGSWSYANTAMFQFALATKTDGTAWGWGRQSDSNSSGNLGQNSTTLYSSPKQIGSGTDWKYIWCSIGASYAFKEIS